jgi:hypothetical protein
MKYLAFMLILAGCGQSNVDGRIEPYFQRFQQAAQSVGSGIDISNISAKFYDLSQEITDSENTIAICHKVFLSNPVILVNNNPDNFSNSTDSYKELLIFHELGHCALNRDHDNAIRPDKMGPKSIMYPSPDADSYLQFREDYISELFKNQSS